MAPSATTTTTVPVDSHHAPAEGFTDDYDLTTKSRNAAPLKKSGALDSAFGFEEVTPSIGREYPTANIVDDLLRSDDLLRDLAITISERGVVFFRAQDNLTNERQKQFIQRLGELSGKPPTSTLHIHPVLNGTNAGEFGLVGDNEVSTISSVQRKKLFAGDAPNKRRYDSARWHSDIQFETCPADYTSLRLVELPSTGGDTLWASGYDMYDRFSKPYQTLLDGLTATFVGQGFIDAANAGKTTLYDKPRGSPANVGAHLSVVHPVVRTNPVTGWKSIYAVGSFPRHINELEREESEDLLKKFHQMILDNHDLQVRFKWRNQNDIGEFDLWSRGEPSRKRKKC
jgi:alpha-ketoglutarate-dependent taurine dioxygenase